MSARDLIGTLRFGARAGAMAAYSLGIYGVFEIDRRGDSPEELAARTNRYMRRYGRDLARLFGVQVTAEGLPPGRIVSGRSADGRGRLFISNHRSGLDILVALTHLEGKIVSRADLARWPIIGLVARRAGVLFVDRSSRRSGAQVVQAMVDAIEAGEGVVIFAEGTTFSGDEVRPFKAGAIAVARRTGCEVVPVGLAYPSGAASFVDESFAAHMRRVGAAPSTRVGLFVGEPFQVAPDADVPTASEEARGLVQRAVLEARRLVGQ